MDDLPVPPRTDRRVLALRAVLLTLWGSVILACWFAPQLDFVLFGWPFAYWFAAQGAVLAFILIVAVNAWAMNRLAPDDAVTTGTKDELG